MLLVGRAYTAWIDRRARGPRRALKRSHGSRTVFYVRTIERGRQAGWHEVLVFDPELSGWTDAITVPPDSIYRHEPVDA